MCINRTARTTITLLTSLSALFFFDCFGAAKQKKADREIDAFQNYCIETIRKTFENRKTMGPIIGQDARLFMQIEKSTRLQNIQALINDKNDLDTYLKKLDGLAELYLNYSLSDFIILNACIQQKMREMLTAWQTTLATTTPDNEQNLDQSLKEHLQEFKEYLAYFKIEPETHEEYTINFIQNLYDQAYVVAMQDERKSVNKSTIIMLWLTKTFSEKKQLRNNPLEEPSAQDPIFFDCSYEL